MAAGYTTWAPIPFDSYIAFESNNMINTIINILNGFFPIVVHEAALYRRIGWSGAAVWTSERSRSRLRGLFTDANSQELELGHCPRRILQLPFFDDRHSQR
jgi:hypothetical protein